MLYAYLADLVLILHAAFIAFVVFGGLLVLWKRRALMWHALALIWGATVIGLGLICPLTPLENHLRRLAGQAGYDGGFIEYYLLSLIYPDGLTRGLQIALAMALIVGNVAVYLAIYRRHFRSR